VQRVRFAPLVEDPSPTAGPSNISFLLDVNLKVSVELGRATMSVRDTLNLAPGHVVELDKLAGDPVDILVNGRLIAKGEVVVVDDQFGVRITEIVSARQRVEAMR
jgi:flagellar motor switch protein FliN/FliY